MFTGLGVLKEGEYDSSDIEIDPDELDCWEQLQFYYFGTDIRGYYPDSL